MICGGSRKDYLRRKPAPVADLPQSLSARALEQSYLVTRMFEFVNVGPNLSLPSRLVRGRFPAGRAARVEGNPGTRSHRSVRQFQEYAVHFFDLARVANQVFIPQQVSETQIAGFLFGFLTGMKRTVLGPQLLG